MHAITKPVTREIVEDFAKEIQKRKTKTAKPSKAVINFRTDIKDGVEREVCRVPIEILRFRRDNGRIASDVMDYEQNIGILDEKDEKAQAKISEFLEQKAPEKTADLAMSIMQDGQREPAIITCDGFIINGNRRKMVMDRLRREHPNNETFVFMKVVILPGEEEGGGGPPTLLEIEKIENRYQLQSDGKSEYYGFDRALSIKRKIDLGLPLDEQLRDDPRYATTTKAQLEKAVKEYEKEYLLPLQCVDRYLRQFKREGHYRTISAGMSDPEGRWQAFKDYSNYTYSSCLKNKKRLVELGIREEEIGSIEVAAFDIIRLRTIPEMGKVHQIMRDLPKYCGTREGKKILKIAHDVEPGLPWEESSDKEGNPLSAEQIDAKWTAKNKGLITWHLKKASTSHDMKKEKETPISLLDAAYKKLTHDNMDLKAIGVTDFQTARKLIEDIKQRADELEKELYHCEKELKKFKKEK